MNNMVENVPGCPIRVRHLDDVIDPTERRRADVEGPLRYAHLGGARFEAADGLLKGGISLESLPCQQPRVVRICVCSSGPDFAAERKYMSEQVYPLVRQWCRDNHGVDFQVADLSLADPVPPLSGSQSPSSDHALPSDSPFDDMTAEPATTLDDRANRAAVFEELRHCQNVSMGPNFVAFVGQKYGTVKPPLEIPDSEMEILQNAMANEGEHTALLAKEYRKDLNVTPHVWRLQPQEYNDTAHGKRSVFRMLLDAAVKCRDAHTLNADAARKYTCSDLDMQLQMGLLDVEEESRNDNSIVYVRHIANIEDHLEAKNAIHFVDLNDDNRSWDSEKRENISTLTNSIETQLCESNVLKSVIELNGCTLDEHKSGEYVRSIGRHFYSRMTQMIDKKIRELDELCGDSLCHEVALHWTSVKRMSSQFTGRENVLNAVKGYLLSDTDQPLVLYGNSGCGKSMTIAKAASDINEAIRNSNLSMPTSIVTRFIGTTENSEYIQQLLHYLCHQLAYITGRYRQDIPLEYKEMKNYFIDLVQRGEYGGMLVILLDSLENISTTDNGHKLDWLPARIAANVKIILTINSEDTTMLQRLQNRIEFGLIQMPECSQEEYEDMFRALLGRCRQTVTAIQWKKIQMACSSHITPMHTKILYENVLNWTSYDTESDNILDSTLEGTVNDIFESLEAKTGPYIVSKVIGYFTASKNGLSESEMEDILSLDDDLLNQIYQTLNMLPALRRVPPSCWIGIRQDLHPFLLHKEVDGIAVIVWKFKIFEVIARRRYCGDTSTLVSLHSNIADYFLGTWSGTRRKPFCHPPVLMAKHKIIDTEDAACRLVPSQPLTFGPNSAYYNIRKMFQLPHSLAKSSRYDELKSEVLCNYDWLSSKLRKMSVQRLLIDFSWYEDRETSLVADALRMSKSALSINPNSLGMELAGRLLPHSQKYPNLRATIRRSDIDCQRCCPLVPNCQIYSAPGGPLQYECGVGGDIHCPIDIDVYTSPDGILLTAKPYYSNRLQVWELAHGDERPDMMLPVGEVEPTRDGRFINIFVDNKCIKTYKSDCGVLHGEVNFGPGVVSDIEVSNKYIAFSVHKGTGPYVVDIERSEIVHKFGFHTHAVAISCEETYVAFNSERKILLYELPVMKRRCVAEATDVAHDIIFMNESPKCYVVTKSRLVEAIQFDIINRKYTCKSVLTDLETKECVASNEKHFLLVRCSKTLYLIDTLQDTVVTRFSKLPPGVFVDNSSTFSGAGFTPDDKMIVATRYTYLVVWDAETYAPLRVLQSSISPVTKLFTSDAVNKVVTLLENNAFQVWNLDNLDRDTLHCIHIHQGAVRSLAAASDSGYVVSHDAETPDAKLVSLSTGKVIDTLQHSSNSDDRIVEVLLSPDGQYAVTKAKIADTIQTSSDTTFHALTDDVMWELESASKVFHASTNRYIMFSPHSDTAAFVTCALYNRYDWSENIYNVFVVDPDTGGNYTIDFPYSAEFVSPPLLTSRGDHNYFVAVIQICRRTMHPRTNAEQTRWTELRLYVQKLTTSQAAGDQHVLQLRHLADNVNENDKLLAVKPMTDGVLIVVYAKDIDAYSFETDIGIVPPRDVHKGAVLYDIERQTTLKHITTFLEPTSAIGDIRISSQSSVILDQKLMAFRDDSYTGFSDLGQSDMGALSARMALDGRYIVGLSCNRRKIVVVRTSDGHEVGAAFVHGRATCVDVCRDDRTVVVGTDDGRVMILSLIVEFADPVCEFIDKLPSRCCEGSTDNLISRDVRQISYSTLDQHRLSARLRKSDAATERRPPSYTTLHRAVTISRQSSRKIANTCVQQ